MINIEELIPLLKKGWVAMDKSQRWHWFIRKPRITKICDFKWSMVRESPYNVLDLSCFDIKPAEDWKMSLIKIG